ncbi:hypothetical protein [Patulibacter defluvii]|uniref:hypothetical protein n=1 Tax=Patulibacter defluvii TaxID=3095358 RepID=UPI002A755479|nr:hypothetical protein [Patulibacter sp. DM4]
MTQTSLLRPAALLLAALALGGCGSSSEGGSTTTTADRGGRTAPDPADREKLQACLKQQGVELPQRPAGGGPGGYGGPPPGAGDGGAPPSGLPGGGGGPGGGLSDEQRQELQAAMAKCGVDRGRFAGGGPRAGGAEYQKRVRAYVACVRKNGFDLPDPDFSGQGPVFDPQQVDQQDARFQKASRACQAKLRPAQG